MADDGIADTTADRFPLVQGILVTRGILAGGATITIVGERMDEYPVLGAYFVSDELPELYGYAVPALRFTFCCVCCRSISFNIIVIK